MWVSLQGKVLNHSKFSIGYICCSTHASQLKFVKMKPLSYFLREQFPHMKWKSIYHFLPLLLVQPLRRTQYDETHWTDIYVYIYIVLLLLLKDHCEDYEKMKIAREPTFRNVIEGERTNTAEHSKWPFIAGIDIWTLLAFKANNTFLHFSRIALYF